MHPRGRTSGRALPRPGERLGRQPTPLRAEFRLGRQPTAPWAEWTLGAGRGAWPAEAELGRFIRPCSTPPQQALEAAEFCLGRPNASEGTRRPPTAAAVLPAVAAPSPYRLKDKATRLGTPLHCHRRHIGHVCHLSPERRETLLTHLQLVRHLAANPDALALVLEAAGPEALPILGRALARRIEALLP